jgi:hypothetical protein
MMLKSLKSLEIMHFIEEKSGFCDALAGAVDWVWILMGGVLAALALLVIGAFL